MPWTKKDLTDDLSNVRHSQTLYLRLEDDAGNPLTTMAERLYCNISIPETDDDGVTERSHRLTVNVNDALTVMGATGAEKQAFLDRLKDLAAYAKSN